MQHNNAEKFNKLNKEGTLQLYKVGNFYNIYGDGAIILNYLFGYKILIDGKVGFSESALVKVINTIEDKKIDYQIINKEKDVIKKYGNYNKVLKQALEYRNIKS